jgi:hypothetical protein
VSAPLKPVVDVALVAQQLENQAYYLRAALGEQHGSTVRINRGYALQVARTITRAAVYLRASADRRVLGDRRMAAPTGP